MKTSRIKQQWIRHFFLWVYTGIELGSELTFRIDRLSLGQFHYHLFKLPVAHHNVGISGELVGGIVEWKSWYDTNMAEAVQSVAYLPTHPPRPCKSNVGNGVWVLISYCGVFHLLVPCELAMSLPSFWHNGNGNIMR